MLTAEQVRHIAKLARLGLSETEVEKFAVQLSQILDYMEKLNEIDIGKVPATSQVTGLQNVMREDEVKRSGCTREELLACSPLPVQNDQIKVLPVITN